MDPPEGSRSKSFHAKPQFRGNRLSFVASIEPKIVTIEDAAKPSMEQSPLTQQARPEVFEPKVVDLYRRLFKEVEDAEMTQGFWKEFFLLKPDTTRLREILEDTDAEGLINVQHHSQDLLSNAMSFMKLRESPMIENALDTLTVFLGVCLAKKYTNPSSDIIEVLAGLDSVDAVFTELVTTLDTIIKDDVNNELRRKAVRTTIAAVAGAYQTVLVSYFINRDFFPALMKMILQLESPLQASEPLILTGLLANYDKFEVQNQYRIRFSDFVHDQTMRSMMDSISWTCVMLRAGYIAIQDDTPIGWSIGGTLSYVGLGSLAGAKPAASVFTEEQQRELLLAQPGLEAATLLTLYDFALSNKVFCHNLVAQPSAQKDQYAPFSSFISFSSYLYQHAYRTSRASVYAYLTLLTLLVLVEDHTVARVLCDTSAAVRLCRQRPPHLPIGKTERTYAVAIIDVVTDGINHNLRKRLDTTFYYQSLLVLSRFLSYLAKSRTKLTHHWSELWRSLLSFVRFLTTYAVDLKPLARSEEVVNMLVDVLIIALTGGEAFLPDAAAYDDLFYKLAESGEALTNLCDSYGMTPEPANTSINTLISVSQHYREMIESQCAKKEHLSPREINKIIRDGYETLNFDVKDDVEQASKFREVEYKSELKRIARVAVADAAALVAR